ncbi:MAG TPA: bifunctional transaldolase/phosoglucose isomerase [Vicinamibacterales bacterium]
MNDLQFVLPPQLNAAVRASLEACQTHRVVPRIWAGDASVWTDGDEGRWLGWLHIIEDQLGRLAEYGSLADEIRAEGLTRVLLLGMGGSSLAPEVLSRTFGRQPGSPSLTILDSTDPVQIRTIVGDDLRSTLFIVASKSGSTLEPNILKRYCFERVREVAGNEAGRHFVAITDSGSQLEDTARRDHFRRIIPGVPRIGGRFSALSAFGMTPAALAGIDVAELLRRAAIMAGRCGPNQPVSDNPGTVLGTILGEAARAGRDKPTIIAAPGIEGLGAWLEQLLAESTGKNGKALIPIDGESPAPPGYYRDDRCFVQLRLLSSPDREQDRAVDALERAGEPVVRIDVTDRYELGAEFFRWEMATAVAGAILGVNPFDQPDVETAKEITRRLAAEYAAKGSLPPEEPVLRDEGIALYTDKRNAAELERLMGDEARTPQLSSWLRAHFARLNPGDYAAILAYLPMTASIESRLQQTRHRIRDTRRVATSLGFGPRYLHSTGQAYKGGPNSGVFLQVTTSDAQDLPVPGEPYTFGVIKAAQARGDFQALTDRGRRAVRVHLENLDRGLPALDRAVAEALRH